MKRLALILAAAGVAGCGLQPEKLFASYTRIDVREVGRSLYCKTPGEDAQAQLFPDLKSVLAWQSARGVTLAPTETLGQAPYAIVEMGQRPTGGYGLAVARSAVLRGELLILNATFVSPPAGSLRTQAVSSPCALVQLPAGRYNLLEVQDQTGATLITGDTKPPAPKPKSEPSQPETPVQPETAPPAAESPPPSEAPPVQTPPPAESPEPGQTPAPQPQPAPPGSTT